MNSRRLVEPCEEFMAVQSLRTCRCLYLAGSRPQWYAVLYCNPVATRQRDAARNRRAQATYMPDTILPVNGSRRNLSRSLLTNRGFDIVWTLFEVRNGDSPSFFFSDVT